MAFIPQISGLTGLGIDTTTTFITLRVLLGVAEAGFFPGMIFFLTIWFPGALSRADDRVVHGRHPALHRHRRPTLRRRCSIVEGFGLTGWQWMYLIEADSRRSILAFVVLDLSDGPALIEAKLACRRTSGPGWSQRHVVENRKIRQRAQQLHRLMQALGNTRVILLAFIYFGINAATCTASASSCRRSSHGFGLNYIWTGIVNMLPYIFGVFTMIYWGRHSDRTHERREHVGLALLLSGLCIAGTTIVDSPVAKMILFILALGCAFAAQPPFWALPATFLTGPAAAAGIAITNSLGNLSGFFGPFVMGRVKDSTGTYTIALLAIAALIGFGMLVGLSLTHDRRLEVIEPDEEAMPALGARRVEEPSLT